MTSTPREGVYYIVREPSGWRLATDCFKPGEDRQHQAMWENDIVPALARQWAGVVHSGAHELERLLKVLVFAFPRGRITKVKDNFVVYHGNDLKPFMRVTKKAIEQAFNIVGRCRWHFDEHEQCAGFEKEEIQRALRLTEDWPAV